MKRYNQILNRLIKVGKLKEYEKDYLNHQMSLYETILGSNSNVDYLEEFLPTMSEDLKENRYFAYQAISLCPFFIEYFNSDIKHDYQCGYLAVTTDKTGMIYAKDYLNPQLKEDSLIALQVLTNAYYYNVVDFNKARQWEYMGYQSLITKFARDENFTKMIVLLDVRSLRYIPDCYLSCTLLEEAKAQVINDLEYQNYHCFALDHLIKQEEAYGNWEQKKMQEELKTLTKGYTREDLALVEAKLKRHQQVPSHTKQKQYRK